MKKSAASAWLIALSVFAGIAAGAEKGDSAPAPAPTPTPGSDEYCLRRDISPEDYAKNCVVQNGPPHRPVHREKIQSKSGMR